MKYLHEYCAHFAVKPFIKFNHEILALEQCDDGQWKVTIRNPATTWSEVFDKVIVCTGYRDVLKQPQFEGMSSFGGVVIHSAKYRTNEPFRDKNVLIVGLGPSASDAAGDLTDVARNVYLSHRRGTWITTRTVRGGVLFENVLFKRYLMAIFKRVPRWVVSIFAAFNLKSIIDPAKFGLQPNYGPLEHEVLITDSIPPLLVSRKLQLVPEIERFYEDGVVLKNGRRLEVDAVVLCTGYQSKYPFIKDKTLLEDIVNSDNKQLGLYKRVFSPNAIRPQSIAFLGTNQTLGAMFPVLELQARLAVRVMKGLTKLPSRSAMLKDISAKQSFTKRAFMVARRGETCVYDIWILYMDELADMIGCKPNIAKYLFTDFRLALALLFGYVCSHHYRLDGPHKWKGAREAILTCEERIAGSFPNNL